MAHDRAFQWVHDGALHGRAHRRVAAAVLGPSYGDSALHASTAHFVVMVASAAVALSGPSVVEAAIGEQLTDAELGGPEGAQATGNVHMVVESEADAFGAMAAFLSYLPSSAASPAPVAPAVAPSADPADLPSVVPRCPPLRLRHAPGARGDRGPGLALLLGRALGAEPDHGAGPDRGPAGRH